MKNVLTYIGKLPSTKAESFTLTLQCRKNAISLALSIIFVNFIDQKWHHAVSICIILIRRKIEHFSNVY